MNHINEPVVTVNVGSDMSGIDEVKSKLNELVGLLEKANSLVRELASEGVRLNLDVHF